MEAIVMLIVQQYTLFFTVGSKIYKKKNKHYNNILRCTLKTGLKIFFYFCMFRLLLFISNSKCYRIDSRLQNKKIDL